MNIQTTTKVVQQGVRGISIYIPTKIVRLMGLQARREVQIIYSEKEKALYIKPI
jgi:hypothetical protein